MEINTLWAEEYRPETMKDVIIPDRIEKVLNGYLEKGDVPNLLFSGQAGCCKTTTAKAIANTLGAEYLFINASDETGKADILNQVQPFATGISIENNNAPKIVILDECIEENETVRIGTVEQWIDIPIKELKFDVVYPIVSWDEENKCLVNKHAVLNVDHDSFDIYEIELENGQKLKVTGNHPFMVSDENGNLTKVYVKDMTGSEMVIVVD